MSKIIGLDRRSMPSEEFGSIDYVVVLVAGEIEDYAAYIGQGLPDWVRRFGNKLSFEAACSHFPGGLERERYRE